MNVVSVWKTASSWCQLAEQQQEEEEDEEEEEQGELSGVVQ